jgi:hypothetical protein
MIAALSAADQGAGTCRSAARSSSCSGVGRSSGFLARQSRTRSPSSGSTAATRASTSSLGASKATRCSTSTLVPSPNGAVPTVAKASTEPTEKTSEAAETSCPRTCSGDM